MPDPNILTPREVRDIHIARAVRRAEIEAGTRKGENGNDVFPDRREGGEEGKKISSGN